MMGDLFEDKRLPFQNNDPTLRLNDSEVCHWDYGEKEVVTAIIFLFHYTLLEGVVLVDAAFLTRPHCAWVSTV